MAVLVVSGMSLVRLGLTGAAIGALALAAICGPRLVLAAGHVMAAALGALMPGVTGLAVPGMIGMEVCRGSLLRRRGRSQGNGEEDGEHGIELL
ncbi:hypothetical protein [uncultured Sphingomonas sp.]|uniref:hypothetical protein n=1 Tax=uncultured Sphingomonas sp. TaxID=158754 RepID=UPI0025D03026|nr:hypothetical protein [uncultured Sphingomonas sp.]